MSEEGELIVTRALGKELRYRAREVTTPDGVGVRVQDWGEHAPPGARDVLLIHGYSQAHLCWLKQVTGPLARRYRLLTYDLRGHGSSQKLRDPSYYQDPKRWAGEVASVIWGLGLENPVVVAHSYAGRVALDYLSCVQPNPVAGLVMVDASSKSDPNVMGESAAALREAISTELAINIDGVEKLLDVFTAKPLSPDERAFMLAFNMATPAAVRAAMARPAEYDATLKALTIPVLAIHGADDKISRVAMSEHTARTAPHAELKIYEGVGHLPFWEEPERFDADLTAFVDALG